MVSKKEIDKEDSSERIDIFNINVGFIGAVIDVLSTIDGHGLLDELCKNSVCTLLLEAQDRLERIKELTNNLKAA